MDHKMVLDIPHALPHPTRPSITTFRTFPGAGSALPNVEPQLTTATEILATIASYLFVTQTTGSDIERKPDKSFTR